MSKEMLEGAINVLDATSSRIDSWLLVFTIVVAIGVAGEAFFGVRHLLVANRLGPLRTQLSELNRIEFEKLQRDNLELRARLAWRGIPADLATTIERALSAKPGSVNVEFTAGDIEAQAYAIQFANLFEKAGWRTAMMALSSPGTVIFGVWIPDSQSANDTATIRSAFASLSGGFSTAAIPRSGIGTGSGGRLPNAAVLFIGSKPPPEK